MNHPVLFLSLLVLPWSATAHEGEDHGGDAKPAVVAASSAGPRAEAQTELFELVATPSDGQLVIYLDRFASNEPVNGAVVEVESGRWKAVARAAGDGTYHAKAPTLARPGTYPLLFTVQAGGEADLMETTLVVSEAAQAGAAEAGRGPAPTWWWAAGGLAALAGLSLLLKRRKSPKTAKG